MSEFLTVFIPALFGFVSAVFFSVSLVSFIVAMYAISSDNYRYRDRGPTFVEAILLSIASGILAIYVKQFL